MVTFTKHDVDVLEWAQQWAQNTGKTWVIETHYEGGHEFYRLTFTPSTTAELSAAWGAFLDGTH
jgi:hypothetical protein